MFKSLFTVLLLCVLMVSFSAYAGDFNFQRAKVVTAEDEARFEESMMNSTLSLNTEKAPQELGRTWYDYATNSIMGRMMAYALDSQDGQDGIHFSFMKRQPDAAGNRYVTYDYWDLNLGLFFGNQSVTEAVATGWGRVINGVNDEALISMHGGGTWLWQDAAEAGYNFSAVFNTAGGVFPGIARNGDTVFFMAQLANGGWLAGDTIAVSSDYMSSWTGYNIWPEDPLMTDYGVSEMWPTFNPTNPTELSVIYAPDITASAPNGSIKMATTTDLGANWTPMEIHNDDTIYPGNLQLIIENFSGQGMMMYGMDGTYHYVCGAVQGVLDTLTSTQIDYFPLLYWNTRDQMFVELSDFAKSHPSDTTQAVLVNNRPGNGLGGFNYPTLAEGPNGELVAIWQEWEDDGTGFPVMATPTGGTEIFCTDIYGAYSDNGGVSWGEPFFITGTAGESDVYPNITPTFAFDATGDSLVLDIAYMWDTNAGVSLFGDSDASEAVWYYERVLVAEADVVGGFNEETPAVVEEFKLSQNYPNPFNPTTNIKFNVSKATDVTLEVFDVVGQKVATLVNGKVDAGETVAVFDGANHASGVYFYQLTAGDIVQTRKMLLVK